MDSQHCFPEVRAWLFRETDCTRGFGTGGVDRNLWNLIFLSHCFSVKGNERLGRAVCRETIRWYPYDYLRSFHFDMGSCGVDRRFSNDRWTNKRVCVFVCLVWTNDWRCFGEYMAFLALIDVATWRKKTRFQRIELGPSTKNLLWKQLYSILPVIMSEVGKTTKSNKKKRTQR